MQAIAVQAHATVLVAQRHRIARVTARVEQGIKKELEAMRATIHDDGDIGQIVADLERRTGRSLPLPSITWPAWKLTTPSMTTETP